MARNHALQYIPLVNPNNTGWTGKVKPWTAGNEGLHKEIGQEQVTHWTPKQIQAAEKRGYFDELSKRATAKQYYRLCEELLEEDGE